MLQRQVLVIVVLSSVVSAMTQKLMIGDGTMKPAGYCQHDGEWKDGKCHCTRAYIGETCETEKCINGGRLYSLKGKSGQTRCHCPFGTSGERCENVTYCEPGKGKLVNGKCDCSDRWTGLFCQIRSCYNGISPSGLEGHCLCDIGYTGPFCDIPLICENGGSVNENNECSCTTGYMGERCDECSIGYVQEGQYCVPEVSESSLLAHTSSLGNRPFAWPIILMGCAAAIALVVIAMTVIFAVRKWSAKPSRVNSVQGDPENGTDV